MRGQFMWGASLAGANVPEVAVMEGGRRRPWADPTLAGKEPWANAPEFTENNRIPPSPGRKKTP